MSTFPVPEEAHRPPGFDVERAPLSGAPGRRVTWS